jgi:hypothetical protein
MRLLVPALLFAVLMPMVVTGQPVLSADAIAIVTDRADGKLAHLDGLNLSRAWMLEGIASGLPDADPRRAALLAAAARHREAGAGQDRCDLVTVTVTGNLPRR